MKYLVITPEMNRQEHHLVSDEDAAKMLELTSGDEGLCIFVYKFDELGFRRHVGYFSPSSIAHIEVRDFPV